MNDWPQWFTDPITAPAPTSPKYRLDLVRRRLAEIRDLITDIERAADSAPDGEIVRVALAGVNRIRRDVAETEKNLATGLEARQTSK
jgi:hypothetical protein